jgi:GT2 family glycosyltransferase
MLKRKFPSTGLISNKENLGFARASNQGIRQSKGRYVLLLNPDTVIQEDTLRKCVEFMDEHSDAGCMGVKMIDGRGRYLPESKRALPVPAVAFFKIFGLTSLFPKSRVFGRYYLGHLDNNSIHEVDVLTGLLCSFAGQPLKSRSA